MRGLHQRGQAESPAAARRAVDALPPREVVDTDALRGQPQSNNQSGKAIQSLQFGSMLSLAVPLDNLARTRQLEEETVLARASAEEQRKRAMRDMADSFEAAVGGVIGMVSSSATELQATAQSMAGTATQTANQTTSVAAAAEEAASNVNTVAAAAEELGSSVQEIGRQVGTSATMAQSAVREAAETAELVQQLNTAVARIGDVVGLITAIAGGPFFIILLARRLRAS